MSRAKSQFLNIRWISLAILTYQFFEDVSGEIALFMTTTSENNSFNISFFRGCLERNRPFQGESAERSLIYNREPVVPRGFVLNIY